ncbi:retrovirus-related pol polyprotein from transposon TNT 1-94 [Tanacetum coccineum]
MAKNVLVRIGKFVFPIDFIILDIPKDDDVPLILGRPFLSTAHVKINVFKRKVTLRDTDIQEKEQKESQRQTNPSTEWKGQSQKSSK